MLSAVLYTNVIQGPSHGGRCFKLTNRRTSSQYRTGLTFGLSRFVWRYRRPWQTNIGVWEDTISFFFSDCHSPNRCKRSTTLLFTMTVGGMYFMWSANNCKYVRKLDYECLRHSLHIADMVGKEREGDLSNWDNTLTFLLPKWNLLFIILYY